MLDFEQGVFSLFSLPASAMPSLVKLPETFLRSNRKAVGSRLPTKPRGFHTMITTIARAEDQHAIELRGEVRTEDELQELHVAQKLGAADHATAATAMPPASPCRREPRSRE